MMTPGVFTSLVPLIVDVVVDRHVTEHSTDYGTNALYCRSLGNRSSMAQPKRSANFRANNVADIGLWQPNRPGDSPLRNASQRDRQADPIRSR